MLNSNDIIKREYENFKRAFVMNAKEVHELIVKTFGWCTLADLMEYMVDDKLVKSKVTFLKLFQSTRECFDIASGPAGGVGNGPVWPSIVVNSIHDKPAENRQ